MVESLSLGVESGAQRKKGNRMNSKLIVVGFEKVTLVCRYSSQTTTVRARKYPNGEMCISRRQFAAAKVRLKLVGGDYVTNVWGTPDQEGLHRVLKAGERC